MILKTKRSLMEMGTETYGEKHCPKCEKAILQKRESSGYGFEFDACPWCGHFSGTQDGEEISDKESAWKSILEHHNCEDRVDLIVGLENE